MPRVTLEWNEDSSQMQVSSTGGTTGDTDSGLDGGAAPLDYGPATGGMVETTEEDAGGPPAWLIEEIANSATGETSGVSGEDAGPAPA